MKRFTSLCYIITEKELSEATQGRVGLSCLCVVHREGDGMAEFTEAIVVVKSW